MTYRERTVIAAGTSTGSKRDVIIQSPASTTRNNERIQDDRTSSDTRSGERPSSLPGHAHIIDRGEVLAHVVPSIRILNMSEHKYTPCMR